MKTGLPSWLSGKESACQVGDVGLIPRSRRSLGEGNGNPLQYSYPGNPMDRGAWRAIVHGVSKESNTTWRLNNKSRKLKYGTTPVGLFATPWTTEATASVQRILQAKILEWVAIFFSRGSFRPKDGAPGFPVLQADSLPSEPPGKPLPMPG